MSQFRENRRFEARLRGIDVPAHDSVGAAVGQ
jgi:hypothetical protein